MSRQVINPDDLFDPSANKANHAVIEDGTLYISGQVGIDSDTDIVGTDIESQARKSFENLGSILTAVDKNFDDVAKVSSYLTNIHQDYDAYKEVWGEFFTDEPFPAHTAIGVDALAVKGLLVEIEAEVPYTE